MPTYMIEGKKVQTDKPLTDAEIDEIASSIKPAETPSMADQLKRQAGLTARTAIETLSAPVNAVADFVSGAYNLGAQALGSESRMPALSQVQQKGLTQMGLPTPETTAEKVAQGGVSGLLGAAQGAAALPKTVLGADLARALPASAAAGAVAQPAAEVAKELTGSDVAATLAGIGVGALAAGAAGRTVEGLGKAVAKAGWEDITIKGKTVLPGAKKVQESLNIQGIPVTTFDEVKQNAQRSYTAMENAGVSVKPKSALNMVDDIRRGLEEANYLPQDPGQAKIKVVLDKFEDIIGQKRVPFTKLEQMRSLANDVKNSSDSNVRRLGGVMVSKIDDYIANLNGKDIIAGQGNLDEAVKNVMSARKDWRNLSRASILEDILNVASIKAENPKASESELIRKGFINLAADKNKMRLFSEAEQNAIKSVAKGGSLDSLLSFISGFNPFRSELGRGAVALTATQNPALAASLGVGGVGADIVQKALRSRQANQAISGLLTGTTQMPAPNQAWRGLLQGAMNPPEAQ